MKKLLKITGITLLVLIVLAFLIPILFKKQITNLVKKEINKSLIAKVDFKDVSLSLFRHFPRVSISVDDVSIIGMDEFAEDTLISAANIDVSANLISIIKGDDIKVSGIYLESPRIHALVNKEGKANWDIAKSDSLAGNAADTSASAFKMSLNKYAISNGYILYRDESSDMQAEIVGLNHEGSGDFTQDLFTLSTSTKADAISFSYAAIPYLVNTKTNIDADIQVDNRNNSYTFKTDDILLNNLKLSTDGNFQLLTDSTYKMDIRFKTPSNDFRDILSMIPAIYKNDFARIKTDGKAALEGFVKGTYGPAQLPAYDVKLAVQNGSFQYPDLPKTVKNIQIDLHASNVDGQFDNTVIDLSKGHLEMDNEPFDFRFIFKNPETLKYIDAAAKGKLDLSQVSQFVKLEPGTKLAGVVLADLAAKGNMSTLGAQAGDFTAAGFLDIRDLLYASSAFPQPLQHGNMKIQLTNSGGVADNTTVDISTGHIEVGKDPVDFTLKLSRPMSTMEFSGGAKGQFTLDNAKQFTEFEPGTSLTGLLRADVTFQGNKAAIDKGEYEKINTSGTADLSNVKYVTKDYLGGISIPSASASFTPKEAVIKGFNGNYLGSNFTGNGALYNLIGYAMKDEALKGVLNVTVDKMNLNDWMGTEPTTPETPASATGATSTPFLVPANLDLQLNAKAGQVTYDKVNYSNIVGALLLSDQTVKLQNVRTEALDGTIAFNGTYSTKLNKKDPAISIAYEIKDIDVQKAFLSFNTVRKLMPIGQFLAGKLNSELTMTGNLNGNMMPDLSSLTGKGNLLLIEGVLKKFAPLEKLASTLQIEELKAITIKDIKNYIEFANGKVLVKPFNIKIKDIDMQIGGMHGFDQSIEYVIAMKVPRKYLGTQGNNLVNGLVTQAANKGVSVKLGDVIDLNVKMGGTLANPSIRTDLKQVAGDAVEDLKQQAVDFAQQKIDSTRKTIKDSVTAVKNQVVSDLKDEIRNKVLGNKDSTANPVSLDSTRKNAEKKLKNTINDLFKKPKKTASDTTKKQ